MATLREMGSGLNIRQLTSFRFRALHGWFFQIATAKLFAYDLATQQFQPIEPEP
jgi:hypothetical protein